MAKNNKFSSLNLAAYFAVTILTAALETAYGTAKSYLALRVNAVSPAAEVIVMTFARDVLELLRKRGRKMLIVLMTERTLTLNYSVVNTRET